MQDSHRLADELLRELEAKRKNENQPPADPNKTDWNTLSEDEYRKKLRAQFGANV